MTCITRRNLIVGAGAFAGAFALAGCQQAEPAVDTASEAESEQQTDAEQEPESDLTPEQESILEDGEPLDETVLALNAMFSNGYATTDGTWDYISGGGPLIRIRPDGSDPELLWRGHDFRVACGLNAVDGYLYFIGCDDNEDEGETLTYDVHRIDTETLEDEIIYPFPENAPSGYSPKMAVVGDRIYLSVYLEDLSDYGVISVALDGSDERVLWTTPLSYPRFFFMPDAIYCAAGNDQDPKILRFDLAAQAEEVLFDRSCGLEAITACAVLDGRCYATATVNGQSGTWLFEPGGSPSQLSSDSLLGATSDALYLHSPRGEGSLDENYRFSRIDLAAGSEEAFTYPDAYSTYNSSFEFYDLGNRLLINIGEYSYSTDFEGTTLFEYNFQEAVDRVS